MNDENHISSLLRIIESLKKSRKQWINKCSEVNKENQQLEERIGKAIEFIEYAEHGDEYSNFVVPIGEDNGCPEEACEELLKILKGEDNNE